MRQLMGELGLEPLYAYWYGSGSHHIHGDWYDIELYHLKRSGKFYLPKTKYTTPNPGSVCPITLQLLKFAKEYLAWRKADKDAVVLPIIELLGEFTIQLDSQYESTLSV